MLAAKGRARLGGRIAAARMVGQFAVMQGRREVDRRVGGASSAPAAPIRTGAPASRPDPAARPPVGAPVSDTVGPLRATETGEDTAPMATGPVRAGRRATVAGDGPAVKAAAPSATRRSTPLRPTPAPPADVPDVTALAIPGYASLSASQVVQRLAGLSGEELEAVRRFEAASRGRRTILARVSQLQSR